MRELQTTIAAGVILLCREFKGKDGKKESYRVDPGLMALLAELRAHERQAAEELGQRGTATEPTGVNVNRISSG